MIGVRFALEPGICLILKQLLFSCWIFSVKFARSHG